MNRAAVLALCALGIAGPLAAQGVLVAPHAIYIDHRVRSEAIHLYNPGTDPVEVTVSTTFGYPVTDSTGRPTLLLIDEPEPSQPSAAAWIQAFPRRVTVPPRRRQTIRLLARPPADLPDGEYWTRVIISARGGHVPVAGVADTSSIRVGLTLEVRTVVALSYRKGGVGTGVDMSGLEARVVGDSLEIGAHLERRGEAAFIGSLRWTLHDGNGRQHSQAEMPLAVYHSLTPRFRFHVGALEPGSYTLETALVSERPDLSADVLLPIEPVRDSIVLKVE